MHTMNIYKNIVATAVIAVASTAAQAVPVPSNETATTLFAGLNWTFGSIQTSTPMMMQKVRAFITTTR
jgi:hypothetical protein